MFRLLRIILGSLLIVLGVIGLFVPILQGVLFLGLGGLLLYRDVPYLPRFVSWLKKRFPAAAQAAENLRDTIRRRAQKMRPQVARGRTSREDI